MVRLAHWAMVAPALALLVAVLFLPSLYVFWLSLNSSSFGAATEWVGLANYTTLLKDPYFWQASLNTFVVVNVVVYVELALGLGMALLFAGGMPFPKVTLAVVLAPYAISEVVAVIMWKYMFEPQVGPVQWLLRAVGAGEIDWAVNPTHGLALVVLLAVWHHLPFTFLLLYAALLGVPKDLYEAAKVDGAGAWVTFRRITFPMILPAILVALLFRYIFAFRIFSEPWLLTQGGPARQTEVLAVYLYKAAFRYHDFGLASATGWAMVVLSLLLAVPYMRITYRRMFAT